MHPDKAQFPVAQSERFPAYQHDSARADNANDAMAANGKMPMQEFSRKVAENARENKTREAVRESTIGELDEMGKKGFTTEISGDALARIKNGREAKLHRS